MTAAIGKGTRLGARSAAVVGLCLAALLLSSLVVSAAEGTRVLEILAWGDEARFAPIIEAFEAQNPGVTVNFTGNAYGEHLDKLLVQIASGNPPDIALIDGYDYASAASRGVLLDVTEWAERDGVLAELHAQAHPAYYQELQVNGRFYSVSPILTSQLTFYYNTELLSQAGFQDINEMGSNWTWDTFLDIARKLTVDADNDGASEQHGAQLHPSQFWPWILSNGGKLVSDDGSYSPFDRAENYDALQWFADLRNVNGVVGSEFTAGTAAMTANWGSAVNAYKDLDFEWDVAAYPAGANGSISIAKGNELVIPHNAQNKELAWQFMKFSGSEEGYFIWGANQVFFPPRRDAALRVLEFNHGYPKHFLETLEAPAEPLPLVDGFRNLYNLWDSEVSAVWAGRVSAREAGERIAELSRSILAGN